MSERPSARAAAMRRHREIFEYGVAHGLSLKDAAIALARARHAALMEGRRARAAAAPYAAAPERRDPADRWMMRD